MKKTQLIRTMISLFLCLFVISACEMLKLGSRTEVKSENKSSESTGAKETAAEKQSDLGIDLFSVKLGSKQIVAQSNKLQLASLVLSQDTSESVASSEATGKDYNKIEACTLHVPDEESGRYEPVMRADVDKSGTCILKHAPDDIKMAVVTFEERDSAAIKKRIEHANKKEKLESDVDTDLGHLNSIQSALIVVSEDAEQSLNVTAGDGNSIELLEPLLQELHKGDEMSNAGVKATDLLVSPDVIAAAFEFQQEKNGPEGETQIDGESDIGAKAKALAQHSRIVVEQVRKEGGSRALEAFMKSNLDTSDAFEKKFEATQVEMHEREATLKKEGKSEAEINEAVQFIEDKNLATALADAQAETQREMFKVGLDPKTSTKIFQQADAEKERTYMVTKYAALEGKSKTEIAKFQAQKAEGFFNRNRAVFKQQIETMHVMKLEVEAIMSDSTLSDGDKKLMEENMKSLDKIMENLGKIKNHNELKSADDSNLAFQAAQIVSEDIFKTKIPDDVEASMDAVVPEVAKFIKAHPEPRFWQKYVKDLLSQAVPGLDEVKLKAMIETVLEQAREINYRKARFEEKKMDSILFEQASATAATASTAPVFDQATFDVEMAKKMDEEMKRFESSVATGDLSSTIQQTEILEMHCQEPPRCYFGFVIEQSTNPDVCPVVKCRPCPASLPADILKEKCGGGEVLFEDKVISATETCHIFAGCKYAVDTSFTEKVVECVPVRCKTGEMPEYASTIQYDDNFCPIIKCVAIPDAPAPSSETGSSTATTPAGNDDSASSTQTVDHETSTSSTGDSTFTESESGGTTSHDPSTAESGNTGSDIDQATNLPFCHPLPLCGDKGMFVRVRQDSMGACASYGCKSGMGERCEPNGYDSCLGDLV